MLVADRAAGRRGRPPVAAARPRPRRAARGSTRCRGCGRSGTSRRAARAPRQSARRKAWRSPRSRRRRRPGASRNVRRSGDTIPNPPATATVGSSSARTRGVTTSPVGSTLVSSTIDDRRRSRAGCPMLSAAAVAEPRRSSRRPRADRRPGRRTTSAGLERAQRLGLLVRRRVGDDDDGRPRRRVVPKRGQGAREVAGPVGRDQHDRGDAGRRLVEPRRARSALAP